MNLRTDLALESREEYLKNNHIEDGILIDKESKGDILISCVDILDMDVAKKLNKSCGRYITLESEKFKISDPSFINSASYILKEELIKLLEKYPYITISAETGTEVIVKLSKNNKEKDKLEDLGFSFEMGM